MKGSGIKDQGSGDAPARSGEHCSPWADEATGNGQQATGNRQQATDKAPLLAEDAPARSGEHCSPWADEATGNRQQATGQGTGNREPEIGGTGPSAPLRSAQDDKNGTVPALGDSAPNNFQFSTLNPQSSSFNFQFSTLNSQFTFPSAWDALLNHPFDRPPHRAALAAAEAAALLETVYPPRADWFAALALTPPERVRVVILGQDPYHEPDQAMGLAFSVRPGVKLPPSLRNIYRELEADLGRPAPETGDLTPWARQGVLLLNTVLTVAAGRANSHKNLGWQALTREIIAAAARLPQPVAFVLWGAPAQRAFAEGSGLRQPGTDPHAGTSPACPPAPASGKILNSQFSILNSQFPRLILSAPHPSPLSAYRGFFGSRPFSQINDFLTAHGEAPIRWTE